MEVNSVLTGVQNNYVSSSRNVENQTVENTELSEKEKLEAYVDHACVSGMGLI